MFDPTRHWRVALQRKMNAGAVVVREVTREDPAQVGFVDCDQVIQALSTNRADQTLNVRGLPGRSRRDDDILDAHVFHTPQKSRP
jgi:hypothetical protein